MNIELITYSDLVAVKGQPGQYRVKVRKRARSVDPALCTGCGACVQNCPVTLQGVEPDNAAIPAAMERENG